MTDKSLVNHVIGTPPDAMFVRIWRLKSGDLIGSIIHNKQAKMFKPKICDLDPAWWRRLKSLADAGYNL